MGMQVPWFALENLEGIVAKRKDRYFLEGLPGVTQIESAGSLSSAFLHQALLPDLYIQTIQEQPSVRGCQHQLPFRFDTEALKHSIAMLDC